MNGHSFIDTVEATEHLKNILNLNVKRTESSPVNTTSTLAENNSELEESENYSLIPTVIELAEAENSQSIGEMEKSGSNANFGNENVFQKVELNGEDVSIPIYGTDVSVISSPLHRPASLKVMMHNVVDFGWDYKTYVGRIMSVHLSMKYLAYSLKSPVSEAGFVRVMKQQDTQETLLIKGFKGNLKDLAFAHSLKRVILACVDEFGQLLVYEILDNGSNLAYQLLMHIARKEGPSATAYHRIFWCPYVPDESGSDDDMTTLLCLTQDERAEVLKVDSLIKEHGEGVLYFENLKTNGYLTMAHHSQPITAAAFSPDGIALATASLDGEVKFFQINVHESGNIPKYLHQWSPHDGKPLSSLFFLDNIKNCSPDVQFWKFAITGADNNQELKLWSCKSWLCLQTVNFKQSLNDNTIPLLKPELDLTGRYLFLSDISRKVLYVLRIRQAAASGQAFICSLSEFAVKFPILNIVCISVYKHRLNNDSNAKTNENEEEDEDDDEKDDDSDDMSELTDRKTSDYLIKLYWITTKSLQSCRVVYQLKSESPVLSGSSISSSQDSFVYRDGLSELLSADNENMNITELNSTPSKCLTPVKMSTVLPASAAPTAVSVASEHSYYKGCDDVLLRPTDFTSSTHSTLPAVNMVSSSFKLPSVDEVGLNLEVDVTQDNASSVPSDINPCVRRKSSQHSSSSSPSREVADILSPRQLLNHDTLTPNEEKESELMIEQNDSHPNDAIHDSPSVARTFPSSEWPQAPDPSKDYKLSRSNSDVHMPLVLDQHEQCRHSLPPLNDGDISPTSMPVPGNSSIRLQRMEQEIKSMHHKLTLMSDDIHSHNEGIQYVQSNLRDVGQQQKFIQNNLQNFITVATNLLTKFEQLSENSNSRYVGVENLIDKWDTNEELRMERQTSHLSQKLISDVNLHLDKLVKQEIKNILVPHVTSYIDTAVMRMQENLLQKLSATDNAIKECIAKNIKSKAFGETVTIAAGTILQQSIQNVSRETFQTCVIPAFEKSCHILLKQMNEIFAAGTSEYVQHMDRQVTSTCNNFDSSVTNVQSQLHKMTVEASSALSKQSMKLQEYAVENAKQNDLLVSKIRQTVQDEVRRSLRDQATSSMAVRSQAASPAIHAQNEPSVTWNDILPLVNSGQINEAFQQTLTAVNLDLLIRLCEYASVDKVFGSDMCPLAQHVLLSLIHQLVMSDLNEKTELKVSYIEDAITSLDSNNTLTQHHIGPVVKVIEQKITAFMQKNPTHILNRHFKRIVLSSKSLLK